MRSHPLPRRLPVRLAALVLATSTLTACTSDGPDVVAVTAQAIDSDTSDLSSPSPSPSDPSPSPSASASPSASPEPSPSASASRPATTTDRARFIDGYEPDGAVDVEHVAADLDGDGSEEVVVAYVRSAAQVAHVDVAAWTGSSFEVVFRGDGGPGSRVDRLRIGDLNADGRIEIVTEQSTDGGTASVTVWAAESATSVVPLPAVGGCADGSNTYGVVGASIEDRDVDGASEIYATCDDSPLPVEAWSTHRYVWSSGAYRHAPETIS